MNLSSLDLHQMQQHLASGLRFLADEHPCLRDEIGVGEHPEGLESSGVGLGFVSMSETHPTRVPRFSQTKSLGPRSPRTSDRLKNETKVSRSNIALLRASTHVSERFSRARDSFRDFHKTPVKNENEAHERNRSISRTLQSGPRTHRHSAIGAPTPRTSSAIGAPTPRTSSATGVSAPKRSSNSQSPSKP